MTIDSEVRHVTKPDANLFLELGFSAAEAKKLHAASRQQEHEHRKFKRPLQARQAPGKPGKPDTTS
jgi:hypothetical protein